MGSAYRGTGQLHRQSPAVRCKCGAGQAGMHAMRRKQALQAQRCVTLPDCR